MSDTRPHFGTDGVRGRYGEGLTDHFVFHLGRAVARVLGTDTDFVIGRDTRMSGAALSKALVSGLLYEGAHSHYAGIITSPGIATVARQRNMRACAVTASHNPAPDNGVKVYDTGGTKISSEHEEAIERELDILLRETVSYDESKDSEEDPAIILDYLSYLRGVIGTQSFEGITVVLDCANGAAFSLAPSVFLMTDAKVVAINTESDGRNINHECGATHLSDLVVHVRSHKADIGFAFDGDADRLIVVDSSGRVCDGDSILALFALDLMAHGALTGNSVAVTSMSNGGLTSFLHERGINVAITEVGDKYVLEEMIRSDFVLGGEQSGHIIRRDYSPWGDGIVNALLIATIYMNLRAHDPQVTSHGMFDLFTPMVQVQEKIAVAHKERAEDNSDIKLAIDDEIKTLGAGARVIIRPSGTEDVVRITVEGLEEKAVHNSLERLLHVVRDVCA